MVKSIPAKLPKEVKVEWLSNDRQSIIIRKGEQKQVISVALLGTGSNPLDEDLHGHIIRFLDRNPKFWENRCL